MLLGVKVSQERCLMEENLQDCPFNILFFTNILSALMHCAEGEGSWEGF
jgi:hypothetical protein